MDWIRIESVTFWGLFAAAFLSAAIWESFRPRGPLNTRTETRWGKHGIVFIAGAVVSVLVLRVSPVVAAVFAQGNRFGILNKSWAPFAVRCVIAILALDFVKYATHVAYHHVPWLWRVHQVHHSDPDFDVSTGLRVHPIETILTQAFYIAVVALLAAPAVAVLIAELLSCAESFLGHANAAALPRWAETLLRSCLVTPTMHRIHHSEVVSEQMTNYGDTLSWWDRLLGTYAALPQAGDAGVVVGLKGYQAESSLGVVMMLTHPFRKPMQELPEPAGETLQPFGSS